MKQNNGVLIPEYDFRGKVAVVTGAGSGIGYAVAMQLAHYGAQVVAAGIPAEAMERAAASAPGITAMACDVSSDDQVNSMIAETVTRFGRLDILVCCAGVGGKVLPLLEQTDEDLDQVLAVNLKGIYHCARAAARQMIAQGSGGRIVLTSSIAYVEGGGLHGPYGASKGAVSTLTRSMAAEWAQYGILVNAVCPGLTRTNINREVWEDPALYQELTAKIPLRRMAEPGEVASLMTYLCTEAAGFITGSIIHCDGGATVGGL